MAGGAGADTLIGGGGADVLIGGGGTDLADYSTSAAAVYVDLNLNTSQVGGDAAGDRLFTIENVTGAATAIWPALGASIPACLPPRWSTP